jgi:hypothetical protein
MDFLLNVMIFPLICILLGSVALWLFVNYFIYRRNVDRLNVYKTPITFRPRKVNFAFSWFIYCLIVSIPFVLILWLIERKFPITYIWVMPILMAFLAPAAYPYYTIGISSGKLNGATQWGWMWRRTEINLNEIDKDKVLRQKLGRRFGVTVIHSTAGIKILTIGLDDTQISRILGPSNEISQ